MENQVEIWKAHPGIPGIQVSSLGNVQTIDRVISGEKRTRFTKGRVLKQNVINSGYLQVCFRVNGKLVHKLVHRLVAETFIHNPDNFPQVNHKDNDRTNNDVSNLEWCTASYNNQYREKYGISTTESQGHQLFAINLNTMEVSKFHSQGEAGRVLGIPQSSVNAVIKGKIKQAGGYYFKENDGNSIEIDRDEINDITKGMHLIKDVFAVNLITSEVSRFNSQNEASRELGVSQGNIYSVIKGKRKTAGGFWFTNDDNADDAINRKLQEIGGIGLKIK